MVNLCMHCMESIEDNIEICPNCGKNTSGVRKKMFLPPGSDLAKRYIVGNGINMDNESLEYIGFDNSTKKKIYIKEFFTSKFCKRDFDNISVISLKGCDRFYKSLKFDFLKYFKSVARIRNLYAVISVYDIFEQNGTVYVIFEYIEGITLDEFVGIRGGTLNWGETRKLFLPFISSLSHMEVSGVRHLGICPQNIFVTNDNKLKLTGFSTKNLRLSGKNIECQLHEGCSALEQYMSEYDATESTDVYGLAATMFFVLTGEYPLSALKRKQNDKLMMPKDILESLPENVVSSLASALRVYPNVRTISLEAFRVELADSPLLKIQDIEDFEEEFEYNKKRRNEKKLKSENSGGVSLGFISCILALIVLLACFGVYWLWLRGGSQVATSQETSSKESNLELNKSNDSDQDKSVEDISEQQKSEKIIVPNLIEKNYKKLQQDQFLEYRLVLLSEDFSDNISEGCIISQSPSQGEEINKGSTIAVTVSKGSKKRSLPDIKGKTLSEASSLITAEKLIPVSTLEFSAEYEEGIVMGYRDYSVGDKLDYGSTVVIVVSRGAQ